MIEVTIVPVGPLACNCAIVVDPGSGEAIVIDPGDEADRLLDRIDSLGARPVALLLTHGHFDHIAAARRIHESTGATIAIAAEDEFLYAGLVEQGRMFGLRFEDPLPVERRIGDSDSFEAGSLRLTAIRTPGHSPGSTCFLLAGENAVLFSGDTLFRESIGRTDLWGGSPEEIERSIRERLFVLPGDLRVVPGHGPETSIAHERERNPFVGAARRFW